MRKKRDGETFGEKIENHLEKLKSRHVTTLLTDAFYHQTHEAGIPFYLRKTNVLRDMPCETKNQESKESEVLNTNKTINIPDEKQIRAQEVREEVAKEEKRDSTYEEFKEQYLDHLLGKIDP